jgi:hypothetical protein
MNSMCKRDQTGITVMIITQMRVMGRLLELGNKVNDSILSFYQLAHFTKCFLARRHK